MKEKLTEEEIMMLEKAFFLLSGSLIAKGKTCLEAHDIVYALRKKVYDQFDNTIKQVTP